MEKNKLDDLEVQRELFMILNLSMSKSNKKIAEIMSEQYPEREYSSTTISQKLKQAKESDLYDVVIRSPRHLDLEKRLKEEYCLTDARVVICPKNSSAGYEYLTTEAAKYIDEKIYRISRDPIYTEVVLGFTCGTTSLSIIDKLKYYPLRKPVHIRGFNADCAPSLETVTSDTLLSNFYIRYTRELRKHGLIHLQLVNDSR